MSKEKPKGPKKYWPAWRYHASAPEGQIFNAADDVPESWVDHPSKVNVSGLVTKVVDNSPASTAPKPVAAKKATKAEAAEEERLKYLAAAQAKFGDTAVPPNATAAELIAGLGGEAAALDAVKALNGNGR